MREKPEDARWPEPPENVRIKRSSGEIIPVDCVFSHWSNGTAVWSVIWLGDHPNFSFDDVLLISKMPPKTTLVMGHP